MRGIVCMPNVLNKNNNNDMFHDTWHQVIDFLNIKDRNTHLRTCKDALTMSKNHGWLVLCHKLIGNTNIFKVDRYKQLLNTNSANIIKEYVRANWFFFYCCSGSFLLTHCRPNPHTLYYNGQIFKCWSPSVRINHCRWSSKDIQQNKIYATFSAAYHPEHGQFIHWIGYMKHKLEICIPIQTETIFHGLSGTSVYDRVRLPLDGYLRILMSFSIDTSIDTCVHKVEIREIM